MEWTAIITLFGILSGILIGFMAWLINSVHKMELALSEYKGLFDRLERDINDVDNDVKEVSRRVDTWTVVVNETGRRQNEPPQKIA